MAIAAGVLCALLLCAAGGTVALFHDLVGANLTSLPDDSVFPDERGRPAPSNDGSTNILLLGSDSRQSRADQALDAAGDQRSDVMMLVHVPSDRRHVYVMSLLRDLWVPVPGHGDAKINAGLAWGGARLAVQTVEQLVASRIDHVVVIDFAGLAAMTSALGGVWVDNPVAFSRTDEAFPAGHFFAGGQIELEGPAALSFVRERKAFAKGDYQRVENQQLLLKGILARAFSRDVLADPSQLADFLRVTSKNVSVDADFTPTRIASFAFGLRSLDPIDVEFFTLPGTRPSTSTDGQSILTLDPGVLRELRSALADDTVRGFVRAEVER